MSSSEPVSRSRPLRAALFLLCGSATCVAFWALLIPARAAITHDAEFYVRMVEESFGAVHSPFSFRIGAPLLARALPTSAETGLSLVTLASLAVAGAVWWRMGRWMGLSSSALGLGMTAAWSTQGWAHLFHNPFMTDGAGLLAVTGVWAAWAAESLATMLLVLAIAPLFRETVAPMGLLWVVRRDWANAVLALVVTAVPLVLVRMLPGMPPQHALTTAMEEVRDVKTPLMIVGDALGSFHGLWIFCLLGLRLAPERRKRLVGPALLGLVLLACGLSVVAINTVRMFTTALPLMSYAAAETFERLLSVRRAWALVLAALFVVTGLSWYPLRVADASYRPVQYVLCSLCAVGAIAVWRLLRKDVGQYVPAASPL